MAEPKKVHWTKRPENKERVREMAKRSAATRNKLAKESSKQDKPTPRIPRSKANGNGHSEEVPETLIAYATGRVHALCENLAASANVSSDALTRKLGEVLHAGLRR